MSPSAVRKASHGQSPRGAREAGRPIFRRFAIGDHLAERYFRHERFAAPSLHVRPSRSGGVPCESLDAPETLPKDRPRQVAFGQTALATSGEPMTRLGSCV